jgi:hypothetical protein
MDQLDPSLARAILLASSFRGDDFDRAKACFLMILLNRDTADAGMIPGEICNGDLHLAGMACASLQAQKLIVAVGRVRSSSPLANGRKVSLWAIPDDRRATVRTWLARNGFSDSESPTQLEMAV